MTPSIRRSAVRSVAIAVVAAGFVPLTAGAAWACSCAGQPAPDLTRVAALDEDDRWRSIAAKSSTAYVGDVVASVIDPGTDRLGDELVRYSVRVVTTLRGGRSGTQVLTTSTSGAMCGRTLRPGRVLVVDDSLGSCGPTTQERVPERAAAVRAAVTGATTLHVVQRGEWLWKVARKEAMVQSSTFAPPSERAVARAVAAIRRANPQLPRSGAVRVGQRLRVPALYR